MKIIFSKFISVGSIFVNDSHTSICKNTTSVSNMQSDHKILRNKIYNQLQKLIKFYSIAKKSYCLVIENDKDDIFESLLILNANINYTEKYSFLANWLCISYDMFRRILFW